MTAICCIFDSIGKNIEVNFEAEKYSEQKKIVENSNEREKKIVPTTFDRLEVFSFRWNRPKMQKKNLYRPNLQLGWKLKNIFVRMTVLKISH